ncbi:MAG: TerC family protein [Acuticoccus sp.]
MIELFAFLADPTAYAALLTLIAMEVVLGIDNLIFISLITNKLPEEHRARARRFGIGLSLVLRLVLLSLVFVIVHLTQPLFEAFGHVFTWRDIVLIAGGLFLVWKATTEIHHSVDPEEVKENVVGKAATATMGAVIVQIVLIDLVFSLDSIITAVGMTDEIGIMVIAVVVAVLTMLLAAGPLARFLEKNPTVVMLALGFLLMIGMTLMADGFGFHVPKGYVYSAMAFSTLVEVFNIFARRKRRIDAERGTSH